MEVSNSLIVALMYVSILGIGVATILGALASVVGKKSPLDTEGLLIGWMVLLLVSHLNLIWHTLDIFNIDRWAFPSFLFVLTGPILMFFATSVLTSHPEGEQAGFFAVSRRFFHIFALQQAWVVALDFLFAGGFSRATMVNVVSTLLLFALGNTTAPSYHRMGLAAAFGIFVVAGTLRSMGVIT